MSPSDGQLQITKATALDEVYRTLRPYPLSTPEQLKAFYRPEINETRGGDMMRRLELGLKRAARDGVLFKASLMGHSGVGKSTELSRLQERIADIFRVIRFSAYNDLDPGNFRPLDVVLVMMMEVMEQTAELVGVPPSEARLRDIKTWFATESTVREETLDIAASLEAGAGVEQGSLWDQVLGLFARLKGEVKYASTRNKKVEDYRLSRIKDLIDLANKVLDECNQMLKRHSGSIGQQWLFFGEDFDKAGIAAARIQELFVTYGNLFQDLRTNLIFNVPISLFYSSEGTRLTFSNRFLLVDTPVYQQDHSPNPRGRNAVKAVLAARMDLSLVKPEALERLIVASGGNLRDLFALVNYAADTAVLRDATIINEEDADAAILNLRSDYERRLGMSPFDLEAVSYGEKADLLLRIYHNEQDAQMTDAALYSLLRARAVQEFNGQRWFGVHPLVVDILAKQGKLSPDDAGRIPGGT